MPATGSSSPLPGSDIPRADYDDAIMRYYLEKGNVAALQTKRGCERQCIYCTYSLQEGPRIHARDPRAVVDDVACLWQRYRPASFFFAD